MKMKVLADGKSDNNNKNNVGGNWGPVPGSNYNYFWWTLTLTLRISTLRLGLGYINSSTDQQQQTDSGSGRVCEYSSYWHYKNSYINSEWLHYYS